MHCSALQLARLSGFNPIITTASSNNAEYCKAAGATHVVDYRTVPFSTLPAEVSRITGEAPVSVVYAVTPCDEEVQPVAWSIVAPNGCLVTARPGLVGKSDAEIAEDGKYSVWPYGHPGNTELFGPDGLEFGRKMYAGIEKWLASGQLKVRLRSRCTLLKLTMVAVCSCIG